MSQDINIALPIPWEVQYSGGFDILSIEWEAGPFNEDMLTRLFLDFNTYADPEGTALDWGLYITGAETAVDLGNYATIYDS